MVTPQLLDYARQQTQKGVAPILIKKNLMEKGWLESDVDEAFTQLSQAIRSTVSESLRPAEALRASRPANEPIIDPNLSSEPEKKITLEQIEQAEKKDSKLIIVLSILLITVLLSAGGVFAYFQYFNTLNYDQVLAKMMANLVSIKSLEYNGEIKAEFSTTGIIPTSLNPQSNLMENTVYTIDSSSTDATSSLIAVNQASTTNLTQSSSTSSFVKPTANFTVTFSGNSDLVNVDNPKSSFLFKIGSDILTNENVALSAEFRNVGKSFYFKFNNLPKISLFDLSKFENQWVKVDYSEVKNRLTGKASSSPVTGTDSNLTPEQLAQIKTAFLASKIIKVTAVLPDETLDGVETYHYRFIFDQDEIKSLINQISKIVQDKELTPEENQKINQSFADLQSWPVEIWIGKQDFYPYKISLNPAIKSQSGSGDLGQVKISLQFKNFNQPVRVVDPVPFKTVEEIMAEFLPKPYASSTVGTSTVK